MTSEERAMRATKTAAYSAIYVLQQLAKTADLVSAVDSSQLVEARRVSRVADRAIEDLRDLLQLED